MGNDPVNGREFLGLSQLTEGGPDEYHWWREGLGASNDGNSNWRKILTHTYTMYASHRESYYWHDFQVSTLAAYHSVQDKSDEAALDEAVGTAVDQAVAKLMSASNAAITSVVTQVNSGAVANAGGINAIETEPTSSPQLQTRGSPSGGEGSDDYDPDDLDSLETTTLVSRGGHEFEIDLSNLNKTVQEMAELLAGQEWLYEFLRFRIAIDEALGELKTLCNGVRNALNSLQGQLNNLRDLPGNSLNMKRNLQSIFDSDGGTFSSENWKGFGVSLVETMAKTFFSRSPTGASLVAQAESFQALSHENGLNAVIGQAKYWLHTANANGRLNRLGKKI